MAAGLPGTGVGGLFFILSAFFMVVAETVRTVRGRSSLARWRMVGRQAAIAAAMVAAVTATIWILHALLFPPAKHGSSGQLVPFAPVLITLAVLIVVLLSAKLAQLLFAGGSTIAIPDVPDRRTAPDRPQRPDPGRRVAVGKMIRNCIHPGCMTICLGDHCADHEPPKPVASFVRGRPWPPDRLG